jgi:hypothetical protein
VKDEQVDLVDAELSGALLEPVQRLLVAVVGDPDLGLEEDVGAVEEGSVERLADLALDRMARRSCGGPVRFGCEGRHPRMRCAG